MARRAAKKEPKSISESDFLYGKIKAVVDGLYMLGVTLPELPLYIKNNLSEKFEIRKYQDEAFRYSINYIENMAKDRQIHLLYHMATGSGKTYIMAGMILYYYKHGYRNFLFFVNQGNIVEKTKENFTNKEFAKYLFADKIIIDGENIEIKVVDNFQDYDRDAINIKFTTVQQLHEDLNKTKENCTTLQDYEDIRTVLIADEAHHLNADTKKDKEERKNEESWESSVNNVFHANRYNVMMEFTATCDLKNESIYEKYRDKIIYNYPLLKYREDGYTKEFLNLQSTFSPIERTIQAMLLSQYRLKLFEKQGIIVKPTILLKSKTIAENQEFYEKFIDFIANDFSSADIEKIRKNATGIVEKMFDFFKERGLSDEDLITELRQAFSAEHLIIMDSKDKNLSEKQKKVNDLENRNNPYRMIFTVDMLSEGWDVLNLFDIVRLYDTRQGSGNKLAKTTIQEAQLIGRGVRYCPFKLNDSQEAYKRKYDNEPENEMRICETLYYHSKQDSRYIEELRQALKEIGFDAKEMVEFTYKVKESFKKTKTFKTGKLFVNEQIKIGRENIYEIPGNFMHFQTDIDLSSQAKEVGLADDKTRSDSKSVFKKETVTTVAEYAKSHYAVIYKALRQYPVFKFNRLSGYYPNLDSIKTFITSDKYAGKFQLHIITDENPTNLDYYEAFLYFFGKLSDRILSIKERFKGSEQFKDVELCKYVKDTERKKMNPDKLGEGVSQNAVPEDVGYKMDLSLYDWYVYDDNYGTTEEKKFVKFFSTKVEELQEKYDEVYLIRNERNLHIYAFNDGRRFEPDYILLLKNNNSNKIEQQQIFVEPKGNHLLEEDKWKEEFLLELESKAEAICYNNDVDEYKIIGLPFYNKDNKEAEFNDALNNLI